MGGALFVLATLLHVVTPPPANAAIIAGAGEFGPGTYAVCECIMVFGKQVCVCLVWS
jgi:hypothetical protein